MASTLLLWLSDSFLETHGTIFHGKRVAGDLIVHVIGCLAEGWGIRGTARVFEIDPNTVLGWLVEAAEPLRAFSQYFLHDLHLTQVQLDELYTVLRAVKDQEMSEAEAIERLSRSPSWVWVAMAPESKLLLPIDVGARTLVMAQRMIHQVVQGLAAGGCRCSSPTASRHTRPPCSRIFASGRSPRAGGDKAPPPSPAGYRCPSCATRRSSRRCAAGAWCG